MSAPPRPTAPTAEMKQRAAEKVVAELINDGHLEEDDKDGAIRDLCSAGSMYMDGYELAKRLDDRHCWSCNREMVDTLDNYSWGLRKEVEAAQTVWAAENNIQPPLPLGTRVVLPRGETGLLDRIYEHGAAQYCVKIDGDPMADGPHQSRRIIRFEDAKELAA